MNAFPTPQTPTPASATPRRPSLSSPPASLPSLHSFPSLNNVHDHVPPTPSLHSLNNVPLLAHPHHYSRAAIANAGFVPTHSSPLGPHQMPMHSRNARSMSNPVRKMEPQVVDPPIARDTSTDDKIDPSKSFQHPCQFCDRVFERRYNLKVHMRRHTGETPYECPIETCKKAFKWRSSMAHHIRSHRRAGIMVSKKPIKRVKNPRFDPNAITTIVKTSRTKATPRSSGVDTAALRQHLQRILERKAEIEGSHRHYPNDKTRSPPSILVEPLTPEPDVTTLSSANYPSGIRDARIRYKHHPQRTSYHQGDPTFLPVYMNDPVRVQDTRTGFHPHEAIPSAQETHKNINSMHGSVNELLEAAQMRHVQQQANQSHRSTEDGSATTKQDVLSYCDSVFGEMPESHTVYWNTSQGI